MVGKVRGALRRTASIPLLEFVFFAAMIWVTAAGG